MATRLKYDAALRYRHGQRQIWSGGRLRIPRTPAQRIMLQAKLIRLKREAERRGTAA